ncbi:hypothetical protein LCGC14_1418200 [marine sediment metagenome]|uniref:50S ribosomal protein L29 n=1 Tax=marine sediment metagenome TaxID=412755 RepID=A0A0F9JSJ6_9ZZZZ
MSFISALKELLRTWNNWDEDKEGRLRREIQNLKDKVKRIQLSSPTKGRVNKIVKLKQKIKEKKNYLIQGAK